MNILLILLFSFSHVIYNKIDSTELCFNFMIKEYSSVRKIISKKKGCRILIFTFLNSLYMKYDIKTCSPCETNIH